MKLEWAFLADYVNVSQDGKLNVLGLFDTIYAEAMPWTVHELRLVLRLEADPEDWGASKEMVVELIDADGQVVMDLAGDVEFPAGTPDRFVHVDQIVTFEDIEFWRGGDYRFDVLIDGQPLEPGVPFHVLHLSVEHPRSDFR